MIRFFNTLGRKIEEFKPMVAGEVKMYTCGPTVWNYPHIGNYRTFLFEDMLRRFLEYRGFKVRQVMNLTDVDDRIINIVTKNDLDLHDFTEKYAESFFEDLDFLRIERAEVYPRATKHVPDMVCIIKKLLQTEVAYRSEDGSIYFSIAKFPRYGFLSGLNISELKAGARVRQDDYDKNSAQDFALWKSWDENDGKVYWDTTLGRGRPGWHIECTAMAMKYLGEHFDIHTGGVDNIFPHHENEIAQSEAYTGQKFVNYWLHSEHLLINEAKMAKRLGNEITIRNLRARGLDGYSVRFFLLSGHYRAQLNFTEQSMDQAAAAVKRINEFVTRLTERLDVNEGSSSNPVVAELVGRTRSSYIEALENDLDSPTALAIVFELVSNGNRLLDERRLNGNDIHLLLEFMSNDFNQVFGVIYPIVKTDELPDEIRTLLKERENARKNKDWKRSDGLREKLLNLGIEVQDTPEGQKWRKTPQSR
ncbi:MAG: cysteine--tRNA ligase [Thaumarchaeota archaeon]|nr:cysteine--tRNA ligase [Nitrososphaerota archaeon]